MIALEHFVIDFLGDPRKIAGTVFFLLLSILFFFLSKKANRTRTKVGALYLHIFFLFLPLVFTTYSSVSCPCSATEPYKFFFVIIPITIFVTLGGGFILFPFLYTISTRSKISNVYSIEPLLNKGSSILNMKTPRVYLIPSAEPLAHTFTSFGKRIFVSIGLLDLLSRKEQEAVILHELYHVKKNASFLKFSTFFLTLFSPLAHFSVYETSLESEEAEADYFVINQQGTKKNLLHAKEKITSYIKFQKTLGR